MVRARTTTTRMLTTGLSKRLLLELVFTGKCFGRVDDYRLLAVVWRVCERGEIFVRACQCACVCVRVCCVIYLCLCV
jgi:hypothetical protein